MEGACGCPIASKCLQHKQLSHFTGKAGRSDGSPGSSASIARRSLDTWSWRLEGGKTGHEPAPRVRPAKTGQPAPRLRRVRGSSRGSPIRAGQPVRGLSGGDPGESEPDPGGCARQEGQTLPEWLTQVGAPLSNGIRPWPINSDSRHLLWSRRQASSAYHPPTRTAGEAARAPQRVAVGVHLSSCRSPRLSRSSVAFQIWKQSCLLCSQRRICLCERGGDMLESA